MLIILINYFHYFFIVILELAMQLYFKSKSRDFFKQINDSNNLQVSWSWLNDIVLQIEQLSIFFLIYKCGLVHTCSCKTALLVNELFNNLVIMWNE